MNKLFGTHCVLILLLAGVLCTSTGCKDVAASMPQEAPAEQVAAASSLQPKRPLPTITGNPNAVVTEDGDTRLIVAAENGNAPLVEALILAGADVDLAGFCSTPLIEASGKGHIETVKLLLNNGASPNRYNNLSKACKNGTTALERASIEGHTDVVRLLLKDGADVHSANGFTNETALSLAMHYGHTEIVKLLRAAGATR